MIGRRAGIGFHAGNPDRWQAHGGGSAGNQTKKAASGDFHGPQSAKTACGHQLGSSGLRRNPPRNQRSSVLS
ncbi:hypothetical protein CSIRO_1087 [Bradyrhizobiaceae bacterium SG-6C]|nr:hypothetical protein CSIRO_1087 [Bradyrhizobiaceae bacterium SG-6C]